MAKLVLGDIIPDLQQWSFMLDGTITVIRKTSKVFIYADGDGDTLTFRGTNLKYSGDTFAGGRVTEVVMRNNLGEIYGRVTELDLKANGLFNVYPPTPTKIRDVTMAGDDTIIGSVNNDLVYAGTGNDRISGGAGNDRLHGMEGNDKLTGGKGIDTFYFAYVGPFGRDRVTDFDVANEQLGLPNANFVTVKDGADTILAWENGSRIRLDDVNPFDFTVDNYFILA